MNRRGFLGALGVAIAGAAASFDPERALWVPGKRVISIPAAPPVMLSAFEMSLPSFQIGDTVVIGRHAYVVISLGGQGSPRLHRVDGGVQARVDLFPAYPCVPWNNAVGMARILG